MAWILVIALRQLGEITDESINKENVSALRYGQDRKASKWCGYRPGVFIMPVIVGVSNVLKLFLHAGHLYVIIKNKRKNRIS